MVEVKVAHLGVERDTNTPIVVLQEKEGDRLIPIYIGHAEANAIAMELADVKFERPLTHDLLQQVIIGLGAQLSRVLLTRVEKSTYYAELELRRDDHVVQIDARPSDSIAIALRLKSPIFASEELLMTATDNDQAPSDSPGAQQLDSDALPEYDALDAVLELYVGSDESVDSIVSQGYDPDVVYRVTRLVDHNEYKRRQSPPGVKISTKAFGKDRRLPITNWYRPK